MNDARRWLLLGTLVLGGCDGSGDGLDASASDDGSAPDADADASGDGGAMDAELDAGQGPYGAFPTNTSFASARRVEIGSDTLQPVHHATQVDFFAFEAQADTVYEIVSANAQFSPDNVIALYDADEELVAENDVGWLWPGDAVDARLVVRIAKTGLYYLRVEDLATPERFFNDDGSPLLFYHLYVRAIDHDSPAVVWEGDDPDAPTQVAFMNDINAGLAYVTVIGELRDGETDAYELQGSDGLALIGHVLPAGVHGNGSTASGGRLRVVGEDAHLLAQIDRGDGAQQIHPPLTTMRHVLTVEADGELGDNSFYAIDLVLLQDNPHEQGDADAGNDDLESAEVLETSGNFTRRSAILSELPAGDVDYYSFEAMSGEIMRVICEGASAGSGVAELRAELRDPSDEMLAGSDETISGGILIADVPVSDTGTHYLRLSSETPKDDTLPPAWARCAVIVTF